MEFDWDKDKATANRSKHGVSFDEAKTVFEDPFYIDFYDPDREFALTRNGLPADNQSLAAALLAERTRCGETRGAGLRILTGTLTSPTLARQLDALLARYPEARWHQWQPISRDNVTRGAQLAYGAPLEVIAHLDQADLILAIDSDLLSSAPGWVRYARDYASRRNPTRTQKMSRLYAVEASATTMGAIVSKVQYDRVLSYIEAGKQDGARLVAGGKRPGDAHLAKGFYVEPTVFADVTMDMRIAKEEIFGPVLSILKWSDEDKMLAQVNQVEYGLTCSIWTNDLVTAHRAAAAVEAGFVWINEVSKHFLGVPFGGYKQSGIGREEGIEELLSFTREKNIHVNLKRRTGGH